VARLSAFARLVGEDEPSPAPGDRDANRSPERGMIARAR
jgi:hypothetical protein